MFFLKKLLSALVLPPIGLLLLAFFGLWLERRYRRLGRSGVIIGLLAIFALSLPPVASPLLETLQIYPPISDENLARAQAIVILGGEISWQPEYGGASVSRNTLERVRYGAYLQRRSALPILASGGPAFDGPSGGEAMQVTIEQEFHGQVKWVEIRSRDTGENAAYSASLLKNAGISRIALVSHSSHLRRAVRYFEQYGLEVIAAPTGFAPGPPETLSDLLPSIEALRDSNEALHEWLGIFIQFLVGAEPDLTIAKD